MHKGGRRTLLNSEPGRRDESAALPPGGTRDHVRCWVGVGGGRGLADLGGGRVGKLCHLRQARLPPGPAILALGPSLELLERSLPSCDGVWIDVLKRPPLGRGGRRKSPLSADHRGLRGHVLARPARRAGRGGRRGGPRPGKGLEPPAGGCLGASSARCRGGAGQGSWVSTSGIQQPPAPLAAQREAGSPEQPPSALAGV